MENSDTLEFLKSTIKIRMRDTVNPNQENTNSNLDIPSAQFYIKKSIPLNNNFLLNTIYFYFKIIFRETQLLSTQC